MDKTETISNISSQQRLKPVNLYGEEVIASGLSASTSEALAFPLDCDAHSK